MRDKQTVSENFRCNVLSSIQESLEVVGTRKNGRAGSLSLLSHNCTDTNDHSVHGKWPLLLLH